MRRWIVVSAVRTEVEVVHWYCCSALVGAESSRGQSRMVVGAHDLGSDSATDWELPMVGGWV